MNQSPLRAIGILGSLLALSIVSTGVFLYTGLASHTFQTRVSPALVAAYRSAKTITKEIYFGSSDTQHDTSINIYNTSESSSVVTTSTSTNGIPCTPTPQVYYQKTYHYVAPTPIPQPTVNMNAIWQQAEAQNAKYSEQSKAALEQFQKESQANMDAFKAQGAQGAIDFQNQMKLEQQQFLQTHGITTTP
jgi:hypothetical protein